MTLPIFPNAEDLLTLLMAELPEGVYATDRADDVDPAKRSNSSSELRAHAQLFAKIYGGLQDVNSDKTITTVTADGLAPYERDYFAESQDSMQSFGVRKGNLLAKVRASGSIALPAIDGAVTSILTPLGLAYDLITWSGNYGGAWLLDVSPLDTDTYLSFADPLLGAGRGLGITPLDCNLDFAAAGITSDQLASIQKTAYTYEVRIHGNADAPTLAQLDKVLTQTEGAARTHVITNNFPGPVAPTPSPPAGVTDGPVTVAF